ncbi:hypothetical protein BGZ83_006103 [Gryganskiella cystojenkinii]|nr:hypothetical protein BGZ83_006103 [Gryganskiella cystojenkinii]
MATAAATIASPSFLGRLRLAKPKETCAKDSDALRIGILGAANIAPIALINPAKRMRSIVVVSVAARDEEKAKAYAKLHDIPNTHPTYDAIINDPSIDCIYNPLPNGLHYEWTKKALEAGKHVLLEKPATANAAQTKILFDLAKEKNRVLLEAFHYRFHPASIYFRELVQNHVKQGHPLQRVDSTMSFLSIFPKDDIRFNFKLAGGVMMDAGCYTVNSIRYFSGLEVESVKSATPKLVSEQVDGRMDAVLQLQGGVEARLNASLTNPFLSIQTWREIIPTFVAETDDKIFTYGIFLMPGAYHYITIKDKATGKVENVPKQYAEGYSTYRYQLEAFVKAVKADGVNADSIPGWVTGQDSFDNMTALDSIYKAAGMKIRE